jgi:molybdate/tungstate transport system ATP-binding protein
MIEIENLSVDFSGFCLNNIRLSIVKGEFFILLGPTGAGKTVLLEAISGLIPLKKGRIEVEGVDVTHFPPEKRGIGIVYQDHCLFPHLTVLENIRYGLHFHKMKKAEAEERLEWLLKRLNLRPLIDRSPANLSGGELQRVALARALIVKPSVLLLDEPLSALDPNFREEIRIELKRLHQETETTILMVTHDFSEVLFLADRTAVINQGRIEQVGEVAEIFQQPRTSFVAEFVGMKNVFPAKFKDSKALLQGLEIELGRETEDSHGYLAIRPEDMVVSKERLSSSMRNNFKGVVSRIISQGFYYEIQVRVRGVTFKALITKNALFELGLREGKPVYLSFKSTAIHTF